MKQYQKHEILTFIVTILDNPLIFDTIKSIRKSTPEGKIMVWVDCCSDGHANKVEGIVDYFIRSDTNTGCNLKVGWCLLYTKSDFIQLTGDDYIYCDNYWDIVKEKFKNPKVGAVGEGRNDVINTYIDAPITIRRAVIEDIGGTSPKWGKYGHVTNEFQDRMRLNGWLTEVMFGNVKHLGHSTVDKLNKIDCNYEQTEESECMNFWRHKRLNPKEDWWK